MNAQASAAPAQERAGRLDWGHLPFFLELVRVGSLMNQSHRSLREDYESIITSTAPLELTALRVVDDLMVHSARTRMGSKMVQVRYLVLADLQRALGRHALLADRDQVALRVDPDITADVTRYRALAARQLL